MPRKIGFSNDPIQIARANLLRKAREDNEFTQQELADRLDVSRDHINQVETFRTQTMNSVRCRTEEAWLRICHPGMSKATIKMAEDFMLLKLQGKSKKALKQ
jgi:ribosome-binding protein aMBF1 (putative translation factor)